MHPLVFLMIILGGVSKFYKRYIPISIGIELKTFFTIVIAYSLGPNIALVSSVFMVLIAAFLSNRFCHWILIKIGVYALISLIVFNFSGLGVFRIGIISVIFLNLTYIFFNAILKDFRILEYDLMIN